MPGGGGISSDVSGIERLLVNLGRVGIRNFSSSVNPWETKVCNMLSLTAQFLSVYFALLCQQQTSYRFPKLVEHAFVTVIIECQYSLPTIDFV